MITPIGVAAPQTPAPSVTSTVKQMAGLLWYNLLSEMNKNGFAGDALGVGGDAYGSMFLWSIAQNDFGKYDSALTAATVQQLGGRVVDPAPLVSATANGGDVAVPLVNVTATTLAARATGAPVEKLAVQAANFAKSVWPQIQAAAASLGVPPEAMLAQSALETGWGMAVPGNNLFGIKAAETQSGIVRSTQEVVNGVLTPQTARFRDYDSVAASVADYVSHIHSTFAHVIGQSSITGFANALQASGYATDGRYAAKIIAIAQSPIMAQALSAVGKIP